MLASLPGRAITRQLLFLLCQYVPVSIFLLILALIGKSTTAEFESSDIIDNVKSKLQDNEEIPSHQ